MPSSENGPEEQDVSRITTEVNSAILPGCKRKTDQWLFACTAETIRIDGREMPE
jgi:hypothetical protein